MKKVFFAIAVIGAALSASAQHHERRDSIPFAQMMQGVMRVPVLQGQTQPRMIVPHEPRICFNVEFDMKLSIGSRIAEQDMFINSHDGLVGFLPPSTDGLINVIMPEIPKFTFSLTSLKGNIYRYYNQKGKHDVIEHYVSTGNTQTFQYANTNGANATPGAATGLFRKSETAMYCNGNMRATAYRADNAPTTWFIYGYHFPEKLHPTKFLGSFGVGFLQTQEGLFLIVEMRSASVQCRVTDIQNSNACFDPNPFVVAEDKFNTKVAEDLQKENAKLAAEEAKISGDCVGEKTALLSFKKENQRRQEENLRKSKEGNIYQDPAAQKAILGMSDPLISVQEGILSTKVSICNTEHGLEHANVNDRLRISEKLQCLNRQLSTLISLEAQMRALDQQYASQIARAQAEKGRLYYQAMQHTCN